MIDPVLYGLFLTTTALLIATPGPIVSLIIAETLTHGPRPGIAAAMGAALIACIYLGIYIFGAASLFTLSEQSFTIIRYLGAMYLMWLGIASIRSVFRPMNLAETDFHESRNPWQGFTKTLVIAATNPKTILFFAAFFPQFISPDLPLQPQLYVLAASFLVVSIALDLTWVFAAARARDFLVERGGAALVSRLAGGLLLAGAILLLLIN